LALVLQIIVGAAALGADESAALLVSLAEAAFAAGILTQRILR
jgi:hypothetical protein